MPELFGRELGADLSVYAGGLLLKHPVILEAAGYVVDAMGCRKYIKAGYSAVLTKSNTYKKLEGGPAHRCFFYGDEPDATMDGSESMLNPGYKKTAEFIKECKPLAEQEHCHIVASISPRNAKEAAEMARELEKAGASAVHMDLQCPSGPVFRNKQLPGEDWDKIGSWWSEEPGRVRDVTKAVRDAVDVPVWPKPLLFRWIPEPEAIALIDETKPTSYCYTMPQPPSLTIDIYTRKRARMEIRMRERRAMVVKLTADLARLTKTPLIPSGGFRNGEDVIQALLVGACAVGFCTESYRNPYVVRDVVFEMDDYMGRQQISCVDEMIGHSLRYLPEKPGPESYFYNLWLGKYLRVPEGDYEWGGKHLAETEPEKRISQRP